MNLQDRLRSSVPKMVGAASAQCNDVEAVWLAADEIDRLQAALSEAIDLAVGSGVNFTHRASERIRELKQIASGAHAL